MGMRNWGDSKSMQPLVSIIMPSYNAEKYIANYTIVINIQQSTKTLPDAGFVALSVSLSISNRVLKHSLATDNIAARCKFINIQQSTKTALICITIRRLV